MELGLSSWSPGHNVSLLSFLGRMKRKRELFSYILSFEVAYAVGLDIHYHTCISLEIDSKVGVSK